MNVSPSLPVEMVTEPHQFGLAVSDMAGSDAIGLDIESNGYLRYPEKLCLVQIATPRKIYIIDPISLNNLAPLKNVLEDPSIKIVVHSADYDIRSLDRHGGLHIRNLYDTSIAAHFSGINNLGLAVVIKDLLGITIPKTKRLQRSDWGRRPLPPESIEYAANDVRYLFALQETLEEKIENLGRTAWVAEEFARLEGIRYSAPDAETSFLSIKGAKRLDGRGRAILRSLFMFREERAVHMNRPPYFILPDTVLVFLAANPGSDFSEVPGLGEKTLQRFGRGIRKALRDGQESPPVDIPRPSRRTPRRSEKEMEAYNRRLGPLKQWRTSLGTALSLDPSLLWPRASLERLAHAPDTLDEEITSAEVRRWQRAAFATSLQDLLGSL